MSEEREEVFRGHLEECLGHLGTTLASQYTKGSKGIGSARAPIADFCGVSGATVSRWLNGDEGLPKGEQALRLICFLNLVGYRVIEFEHLSRPRQYFFELLGFGVLTTEAARQIVGYTKHQTLFQVLQGKQGSSKDKDSRMWDAWKIRKEELEQKKAEARERYRLGPPKPTKATGVPDRRRAARAEAPPARRPAVVSLMEGLLALLEEDSFEERLKTELSNHPEAATTMLQLLERLNTLSFHLIADQLKGGDR